MELIGKVLKDENNEEYQVLNELYFKNILCVYCIKNGSTKEEDKKYFQVTNDIEPSLITIKSNKMISSLNESLMKDNILNSKPRKIKEDESISDYFNYLNDYYKSKIVTNL